MAEIVNLAGYRRQRAQRSARQLRGEARNVLVAAEAELLGLRGYADECAVRLFDTASALPDDDELRLRMELLAGEFTDVSILIGGGDPRALDRECAALIKWDAQ